jgi:DNA polymerase III epsilon subunit-like protein
VFTLNNPLIVIDLEATASTNSSGHQENNCIIEIGAVALDLSLNVIGEFSSLVQPSEPISPFIEKLTGITGAMVAKAPPFSQVGPEFVQWATQMLSLIHI